MNLLPNYLHCIIITYSILLLWLSISTLEAKKIPCPALPLIPGVVVSCIQPKENNRKIACTGPIFGVWKGTIGKYRCEGDSDFAETVVECKCYGKWKGLEDFQSFTSACVTVQKNFSLSGPPELALTPEQVLDLDGNIPNQAESGNSIPKYALDTLAYHNFYRKRHGAAPLKLNETLSKFAQSWSEHESNLDSFRPEPWSTNKTYISNMYELTLGSDGFDPAAAGRLAVGKWYNSGANYDYELPVANAFSAMMWNTSTDLGVGIASKDGSVWVVCNYWPPGNVYLVGGQNGDDSLSLFRKNVFPPLGNLTSQ